MICVCAIVDSKALLEELKLFSDALSQSEAPLTRKGSDDAKFWQIADVSVHMYQQIFTL